MSTSKRRVPPNQRITSDFPILHSGLVPRFDPRTWIFQVEGLIENPIQLSYREVMKLPKVICKSDFHCVTGWSRLNNKWEGVRFSTILDIVKPLKHAKFATSECEGSYTTSLPLEDLLSNDVLLAYKLDGESLSPSHGGPLRLVVPRKYAYKSAKWVRKLVFTAIQELGFWEKRGYSDSADVWKNDRYVRSR